VAVLPFAEPSGLVPGAALFVPAELPAVLEADVDPVVVDPVVFAPASVTLFWT
jgi:hypothetical protein